MKLTHVYCDKANIFLEFWQITTASSELDTNVYVNNGASMRKEELK